LLEFEQNSLTQGARLRKWEIERWKSKTRIQQSTNAPHAQTRNTATRWGGGGGGGGWELGNGKQDTHLHAPNRVVVREDRQKKLRVIDSVVKAAKLSEARRLPNRPVEEPPRARVGQVVSNTRTTAALSKDRDARWVSAERGNVAPQPTQRLSNRTRRHQEQTEPAASSDQQM
jgi:hypothetical protein